MRPARLRLACSWSWTNSTLQLRRSLPVVTAGPVCLVTCHFLTSLHCSSLLASQDSHCGAAQRAESLAQLLQTRPRRTTAPRTAPAAAPARTPATAAAATAAAPATVTHLTPATAATAATASRPRARSGTVNGQTPPPSARARPAAASRATGGAAPGSPHWSAAATAGKRARTKARTTARAAMAQRGSLRGTSGGCAPRSWPMVRQGRRSGDRVWSCFMALPFEGGGRSGSARGVLAMLGRIMRLAS